MSTATLRAVHFDFSHPEKQKKYASGGLAAKAEDVRKGVGPSHDTVLLHVNPQEYEFMKQHFGPERINPNTGLPQFGFFSDFLVPVAAIVATAFLGPEVGAAAGSALGLGLSSAGEAALGSGLIGAGIGGVTGGAKGAVLGGLTAGIGSYALGPAGLGVTGEGGLLNKATDSLGITGTGGLTEQLGLDKLLPGTTTASSTEAANAGSTAGGVRDASIATTNGVTGGNAASWDKAGSGLGSLLSGGNLTKYALPALVLANAVSGKKSTPSTNVTNPDVNFSTRLSTLPYSRTTLPVDVTREAYGDTSNLFFKDNALPKTVTASTGRYVKGGGTGVSDSIPARLSDGEYVIDAQTVSMLGDGSSDAGAKKLDQMREEIRKQKGGMLAQGKFPPKAHAPLSYIRGA